jgi:hypothetical protein
MAGTLHHRPPLLNAALYVCPAVLGVAILVWASLQPRSPEQIVDVLQTPAGLRIALDASASMSGYFNGKTAFKDRLVTLLSAAPHFLSTGNKPPKGTKPLLEAYLTTSIGGLESFTGGTQTLIADVLGDKLMTGDRSMLQDALAKLRDLIRPDEVGLLLTDGIFSHSNADIRRNPEINRNNIEALAAQVRLALGPDAWSQKKLDGKAILPGLAILQYFSEFHGIYYDYRNTPTSCCAGRRPYYVWVIGEATRVAGILAALRREPGLLPEHELALTARDFSARPRVLNYSNKSGRWTRNRQRLFALSNVSLPPKAPLRMAVALDLPFLPDDMLTADHLARHLTVKADYVDIQKFELLPLARVAAGLKPQDQPFLDGATHILDLQIRALLADKAVVSVALDSELPDWCREASTDDDRADVAVQVPPRTFGFLPVVTKAARAMREGSPLVQFQIFLER